MADALTQLAQLLADVRTRSGPSDVQLSPEAFFGNLAQLHGGVPPDILVDRSTPWAKIMSREAGVWPGPPLGPRESGSATLGSETPWTHPTVPSWEDYTAPEGFLRNDAPPTHYYYPDKVPKPVPQPRDPWAMLRTAPINQMFARRIPGLY